MPSLPNLPSHLALPSTAQKWKAVFLSSLNFYRIHLLAFTIIPLITSGIMYAANTQYHIDYVDCLFCCMSAMTVTGLATINLSTLSVFQQVLLVIQMIIGSLSFVSILMVIVRQYFFRQTFKHVLKERQARSRGFNFSKTFSRVGTIGPPLTAIKRKFSGLTGKDKKEKLASNGGSDEARTSTPSLEMKPVAPPSPKGSHKNPKKPDEHKTKKKGHKKINPDMIKRVSGGGVGLVNPMGWYDGERTALKTPAPTPEHADDLPLPSENGGILGLSLDDGREVGSGQELGDALEKAVFDGKAERRISVVDEPGHITESPGQVTPEDQHSALPPSPRRKTPYAGLQLTDDAFPRSKTIAFDDEQADYQDPRAVATGRDGGAGFPRSATFRSAAGESRLPREPTMQSSNFPRTYTLRPTASRKPDTRLTGFGGFPTPFEIGKKLVKKAFPEATSNLTKSLTMSKTMTVPRTNTVVGRGSVAASGTEKEVPYISFAATVGRNSMFHSLTAEQMDELGGVEYRALRVLLYIVVGYFIFFQLAAFVIIAPYIAAQGRYQYVFDNQPKDVKVPWFAFFQSISAFSNTGMSLCDMSMVPFQRAYLLIVVTIILIFAGNTAFTPDANIPFPSTLIYKLVPQSSRTSESLKFLLDHPRRCFVYLFPSTQTWVLLFVLCVLTSIDWVSFLVLDIGTPAIEAIPVGTRIAAGLLQSAAVRAAGFGIVPLAAMAPAVKVLYVIMMYISVYPIALSVRATNVYEEKSLGLFGEEEDEDYDSEGEGAQAVAKYIGWHARRQLAFDIWWLAFALWLICIIERGHINNEEATFNIFNVIFELVSAYGTVGLSLGVPDDNYSFSGGFRKLSKLIMVVVMLRGRHRGLPVAIDRAVMLPKDFTAAEETAFEEERSRRASRRGSLFEGDVFGATRRGSHTTLSGMAGRDLSPIHGPNTALPGQHHHHLPGQPTAHQLHHPTHNQHQNQTSHRRSSSFGGSLPIPNSPSSTDRGSLQFSLPRTESLERPPNTRFRGGGAGSGGAGGGSLTPVKESSMSRNPTIIQGEDRSDPLNESAIV
uniref:Potassium transport protein n=1 Tax=Kwoniella dejecticola CBS 10117 TaxID=1296121 RepID=A0A1A6AGT0_9TREE|nr:potassium ion transporter [Kwoniella dejecticola CBS 10117]OBR89274.1 potassium ion transporter [Kwoniella dejecticola CBS 10117]